MLKASGSVSARVRLSPFAMSRIEEAARAILEVAVKAPRLMMVLSILVVGACWFQFIGGEGRRVVRADFYRASWILESCPNHPGHIL